MDRYLYAEEPLPEMMLVLSCFLMKPIEEFKYSRLLLLRPSTKAGLLKLGDRCTATGL